MTRDRQSLPTPMRGWPALMVAFLAVVLCAALAAGSAHAQAPNPCAPGSVPGVGGKCVSDTGAGSENPSNPCWPGYVPGVGGKCVSDIPYVGPPLAGGGGSTPGTKSISFTADDGVVLHATIAGDGTITRRPLIIEDSPYAPGVSQFAGPAYNYIELQWRGTGLSGGTWSTTGPRDQRDLSEFVGWACRQPWSDGRIGLYGFSASAIAVYNTMHLPLPCVKAAALMAGTVDLYRDLLYIGGIPNAVPGLYVEGAIAAPWLQNFPGRVQQDPTTIPDSIKGYATAPPTILSHQTEDAFWRARTFKGDRNHIPILADSSFYDVEPRGAFLAYRATRRYGSHLLVMGAHDGFPAGTGGPFPQYVRWFDHYVRGIDNGINREPPVSLYLSNGSREQFLAGNVTHLEGSSWPLKGTSWTPLYLSAKASGTAHSINDGTLSLQRDASPTSQSYPFAPSDAIVTDPHTTAVIAGLGIDQAATVLPALTRMDAAEPGSLTYTTAPFKEPVDVVGPASLDVFASSTAPETDLVAVLADVAPDGSAYPVASGTLRTDYPRVDRSQSLTDKAGDIVQPYTVFSAKEPALPETRREYHVELLPIGNHFAAGHRLRLYLVGTPFTQVPVAPGVNSLSIGDLTPSRLLLPTYTAPVAVASMPQSPLPGTAGLVTASSPASAPASSRRGSTGSRPPSSGTQAPPTTLTGRSRPVPVCVSRRALTLHVRSRRGYDVRAVTVYVNGHRLRTVRGRRLHTTINLRGLPRGKARVRVVLQVAQRLSSRHVRLRTLRGVRTYRTCATRA